MAAAELSGINFNNTLGAAFCGFAGATLVYGILCTQIWTYYRRYTQQDGAYRFLVLAMWVLETVHQALIGHSVYYYTITNYANPLVLLIQKPVRTLILQIIVSVVVGVTVKTVFAIRVWRISNHNYAITAFLLLVIYTQLGLAIGSLIVASCVPFDANKPIVFTYRCFRVGLLTEIGKVKLEALLALGAGTVTDVCVAAALCYYLQKMRTGFARCNVLINSMQYHAVDTGILTSVFSLATLILFSANSKNMIFMGFYFVLSKLYATSLLAALNFRKPSTTNRGPKARMICPGNENMVINIARRHYHENLNEVQIEAGAFTVKSVTRDARELEHQPQFTEAM